MAGVSFALPFGPRRLASAVLFIASLTACDAGAPAPAGGVSKGEAEALAEAAEMLDERRGLSDEAVPEIAAPASGPASPEMTGETSR